MLLALFAIAAATQLLLAYNLAASDWNGRVFDRAGRRSLWYWDRGQLAAAWGASVHIDGAPATTPGGDDLWGSVDEPAEDAAVAGRLRVRGWARIPGADLPVTVYLDDEPHPPVSSARPTAASGATPPARSSGRRTDERPRARKRRDPVSLIPPSLIIATRAPVRPSDSHSSRVIANTLIPAGEILSSPTARIARIGMRGFETANVETTRTSASVVFPQ